MELLEIVRQHAELLDRTLKYERDYAFDYFGFKALISFFFFFSPCNLMRVCVRMRARLRLGLLLRLQSTICFIFSSFFLSRLLLLLPLAGVGAVAETLCLLQHLQQMLT
jgi:hypothetical protein